MERGLLHAAAERDDAAAVGSALALGGAAVGLGWWLGAFADDDAGSF